MSTSSEEIQILYKSNTTKSIGGITIDAFIQENYEHSATVTEYPVENGSTIADHIVQDPDQLSIEGMVGDIDIYEDYSTENPPVNRAGEYYSQLLALKEAGELITVVCGLRSWSNMAITSLSIPRNAENGKGLMFSMSLKKVTVITSKEIVVSKVTGDEKTKKQAQSKVNVGKVSTTEVTDSKKRASFMSPIKKQLNVTN